jgi:Na+/alanine symporter
VAEFQYKRGYATTKNGWEGNPLYYLSFHLRQHLTQFFFSMLSSTAYGRNIIPPHICYSIIVQMIDFWFKIKELAILPDVG